MKKRGKTISVNVKLTYPKSSRIFKCGWVLYSSINGKWERNLMSNHHPADGDELILCNQVGCRIMLCQEHMPAHQEWHILGKLGGENR